MSYILEVQQFYTVAEYYTATDMNQKIFDIMDIDLENGGKEIGYMYKLGYMKKTFKTKKEACNYYDYHNPHMRSVSICKDFVSDWDVDTKMRYIVRNLYWERFVKVPWYQTVMNIPPFAENPRHYILFVDTIQKSI
jgi:hypothetical protein